MRKLDISMLTWALSGFLFSYMFFFVFPIFHSGATMLWPEPVPRMTPIGADVREIMAFVQRFFVYGGTPYVGTATYPPLSYLLLGPLLLVAPAHRYLVLSCLTLVSFVFATLRFPLGAARLRRPTPELLLVFATALVSYGLLFELERGQFNVLAALLAYSAIWIFHARCGSKIPAYVLFTLSVQLKLYPLMFLLMFVRDWRDWSANLRRLGLLVAVNLGLFFGLGWQVFLDFVDAVREASTRMDIITIVNHSAYSFVGLAARILDDAGTPWSQGYQRLLQAEIFAIVVVCLAVIVVKAWRQNSPGINPFLLFSCAATALIVPAVSADYTLAILPAPVGLLLAHVGRLNLSGGTPTRVGIAMSIFCIAYSSTLIPPAFKPQQPWLQNALPALLLMMIAAAFVAVWSNSPSRDQTR